MPLPGNCFVAGIAYWSGNPTNVATTELNVPKGTIVLDSSTPAVWQKVSALGSNATYNLLAVGGSGTTLTDPVIVGGLTASGSVANDFSGSTGAFKTSSGANTIEGAA